MAGSSSLHTGPLPSPQCRYVRGVSTRTVEAVSRPVGLRRPGEVKTHPASPLSPGANGFGRGDVVEFPQLGRLRISDSLYVMHDGSSTIGLLVGRDRLDQTCVVTLSLKRTNGPSNWRGTVQRITRKGGHSDEAIGTSFSVAGRGGDAEGVLEAASVR